VITEGLDALASIYESDVRLVRDRERSECCVKIVAIDEIAGWGATAEQAVRAALLREDSRLRAEIEVRVEQLRLVSLVLA
jgi:hypothetical protein